MWMTVLEIIHINVYKHATRLGTHTWGRYKGLKGMNKNKVGQKVALLPEITDKMFDVIFFRLIIIHLYII